LLNPVFGARAGTGDKKTGSGKENVEAMSKNGPISIQIKRQCRGAAADQKRSLNMPAASAQAPEKLGVGNRL